MHSVILLCWIIFLRNQLRFWRTGAKSTVYNSDLKQALVSSPSQKPKLPDLLRQKNTTLANYTLYNWNLAKSTLVIPHRPPPIH